MNPASPLQLGDHVEIVGPAAYFKQCARKKTFRITDMPPKCRNILLLSGVEDYADYYSASDVPMYPASSLRKVEELQIGDFVEVVGPSITGLTDTIGKRFMIEEIDDPSWPIGLHGYSCHGVMQSIWPASSLRKLTPEEIAQHQKNQLKVSVAMDVSNALAGIEKVQDNLWKIRTEARLSAIEDRQESIDSYITRITNVGAALEKRLAFVEAFQKEQAENAPEHKPLPRADPTLAAMIADGTLEVSDFRKQDLKTKRKIIKQLEEDLANDCTGMTCAECMDEVESDGIRIAALEHAIRWLRMPDMRRDPLHSHEVADVLEGMMEEMEK